MRHLLLWCTLLAACDRPPALLADARQAELVRALQQHVARSVAEEKTATLATTDEESERAAAASRAASAEVERLRAELKTLVGPEQRPALEAFDAAWARMVAIDAELLPLAVANTNLKAAHLSHGDAARTLDALLAELDALATRTPARARALLHAEVAAARIQGMHAPHIASPDDAEMTGLEQRIAALEATVDAALATAPSGPAAGLWAQYKQQTRQIFALSRANTNVRSFALSVHEKADATRACDQALTRLVERLHQPARATR